MMKKTSNYETLYRKNSSNGCIIIDIALEDYWEYFHEWDNATFKKRDIHPELADFLDLCSEDIPIRKRLEIHFFVKHSKADIEKEKLITASYYNYYKSLNRLESRKIKRNFRLSFILFLIALFLISAYVLISGRSNNEFFSKVFLEGLLIGGWVFMWEALHMMCLESLEPLKRRREIQRFQQAVLKFRYEPD